MANWSGYTIYDVKSLQYNPPFFALNNALAKRMVGDIATDLNTQIGRHPADFKLYKVGLYSDETGIFESLPIMEHVCDVVSLLPAPQPNLFEPSPELVKQETQRLAQNILDHAKANGAL